MNKLSKLAVMWLLVTGSAQATTYNVTIAGDGVNQSFAYDMSGLPVDKNNTPTILAGDRVNFAASALHPLFFHDQVVGVNCNTDCSITFITPSDPTINVYIFACTNHSSMVGNIRVDPNPDVVFIGEFETPVTPAAF